MYNSGGNPTLTNVTFASNSATVAGGGLYNLNSSPLLMNVIFNGNMSSYGVGGMYNDGGNPVLMNTTFMSNASGRQGGGMYNTNGNPSLTNVTFTGNSAHRSGGGMYNSSGNPTLTNVTFSGNSAPNQSGGALYNSSGNPTLTNVTFSGNSASPYGGGIYVVSDSVTLRNAIFWGNTADSGGPQIWGTATVSDSVIEGGCPSGSTCSNIIAGNPLLGTLGNYGGNTQTIPLLPGSSAIDAGNGTYCPVQDQRGVSRVGTCDIGAFESRGFTLAIAGGNNQSAMINTPFANPLQVSVTSLVSPAEPVNGGLVTFTAPLSGASVMTTTQMITITNGIAAANERANGIAGSYQVTASARGASAITFSLANKAGTTASLTVALNPSVFGQAVTFTATVTSTGGIPTGSVTFKDGATTLGTGTLSGSTATFTTSALAVGSHDITATYGGDTNFNSSTSATLTQVVNKANTTTNLISSPNPSVIGQSVTFTATITAAAPGSGTPTGSVTFKDGATTLGTGVLSGNTVTLTISSLVVGSHSITATFSGDTNFNASSSTVLSQVVNKANTMTVVSSSVNPSVVGQSVTFTATVTVETPGAGTPTGTVTFKDGATTLGTGTLSGGMATLNTFSLALGSHDITVTYAGDTNFNTNTSAILTQVVNKANTTTTITSSPNPSLVGQSVTFTATVSATAPSSGIPTGSITFKDGTTTIGIGTLAGGTATFTTSALTKGSHSITAVYGGDTNYNTSTSSILNQTVGNANTTTTISSSPNPSVFGQTVIFTATVTAVPPATGTPTGNVTLKDGTTSIGTAALSSGKATFTISTLAVGSHSITAAYDGDTEFNGSTSSILTQTVNKASTATTLDVSANPSLVGQSVTFTATVSAVAPGVGAPTGTVTFRDGATTLGTGVLSGHTATFTTSALTLGSHSITAVYSGDANFNTSSSATLTHAVNQASTTTAVSVSANPSVISQTVTLTATVSVSAPGSGTPTGTVAFKDGPTTLGTGTLSGGTAILSVNSLGVGSHTITAVYAGDTNFIGSTSSPLTQIVNKSSTLTTLTGSVNPSVVGQSVTFTATVSVVAPGTGAPSGTVTFKDGVTTLGTGTLSNGTTTLSTSLLTIGSHTITAEYGGNTNFDPSTSVGFSQIINKASTTTALESSINPSTVGQSVTFTATVTVTAPGNANPSGSVTFKDGSTTLGTSTLSGGKAALATSVLTGGSHSITAVYGGDANLNGSTSAVLTQMVKQASSTTVSSSVNPSVFGQSVTFTATVGSVPPGGGTPSGTVTFKDGVNTLGTATLSGGQAMFTALSLSTGSHTITVVYGGDTSFNGSTSSAFSQTVNKAGTTTAVTKSVSPSVYGQSVTFTATVTVMSPGSGNPSGTVTFKDGATTLGTAALNAGKAMLTIATLGAGTHSITAVYAGDTNFDTSTSGVLTQTVNQANTSITIGSSSNPSGKGQPLTLTANVTILPAGGGIATGIVTFRDGASILGTGSLSGGKATFTTSSLTIGNHSITATYEGDTNCISSTSSIMTQVINEGNRIFLPFIVK